MQKGNTPLTKQQYEQLFQQMIDYLERKKVTTNGNFSHVIIQEFDDIFKQMEQDRNLTPEGLSAIKQVVTNISMIQPNKSQASLINDNSHLLNIKLQNGEQIYVSMASQCKSADDNHAYLCKISNNNGKYTYDIWDSLDSKYEQQAKDCLNKETVIYKTIESITHRALQARIARELNNKLQHIEEQEIAFHRFIDQEKMGHKFARACSVTPLMHLVGELHKEGEIDIQAFKGAISIKKEEGSKLNLSELVYNKEESIRKSTSLDKEKLSHNVSEKRGNSLTK